MQAVLLCNNGLHIEIQTHASNKKDDYIIKDVILEPALITIQDCEDSGTDDKVMIYRSWLGLMRGGLSGTFVKTERSMAQCLSPDRHDLPASD